MEIDIPRYQRIKHTSVVDYLNNTAVAVLVWVAETTALATHHNVPIIDLGADLVGKQFADRNGSGQAETG